MSYVPYIANVEKIRFEKHIQLFDSKFTYEMCYKSYLILYIELSIIFWVTEDSFILDSI